MRSMRQRAVLYLKGLPVLYHGNLLIYIDIKNTNSDCPCEIFGYAEMHMDEKSRVLFCPHRKRRSSKGTFYGCFDLLYSKGEILWCCLKTRLKVRIVSNPDSNAISVMLFWVFSSRFIEPLRRRVLMYSRNDVLNLLENVWEI